MDMLCKGNHYAGFTLVKGKKRLKTEKNPKKQKTKTNELNVRNQDQKIMLNQITRPYTRLPLSRAVGQGQ